MTEKKLIEDAIKALGDPDPDSPERKARWHLRQALELLAD